MASVSPDRLTETDRGADLAHHVVLKQAIDRGARACFALARKWPRLGPRRPAAGHGEAGTLTGQVGLESGYTTARHATGAALVRGR